MDRALVLPAALRRGVEETVGRLYAPAGREREDFARPPGEPALVAPDSLSWRVFKNPAVLFVGGVAAVVLELAEPRVRTGVWEHSAFRRQPLERLRRTALATVVTVYGARSRAEALVARVTRLHERVAGTTPQGERYAATDRELLDWVQATAAFGFAEAHHAFVRPLAREERDRLLAEGVPAARLYGATGAPRSQAALEALFAGMRDRLEPSPIVHEFLGIVRDMPVLPAPVRPVQRLLLRAAVEVVPAWARSRLGLRADLAPWEREVVKGIAGAADRLLLPSSAAVQACRRMGLPDDYLYSPADPGSAPGLRG
ncbi:MAG TPA: oxygenase MpaB family protein [Albitalea sp.]